IPKTLMLIVNSSVMIRTPNKKLGKVHSAGIGLTAELSGFTLVGDSFWESLSVNAPWEGAGVAVGYSLGFTFMPVRSASWPSTTTVSPGLTPWETTTRSW
ncbi:MAG: hypothetical protein QOI53_1083, partial [Verrucomicrobiota bacterium]|nr:hypothetical protein [Verrucomicrobiota bacterium]